MHSVSIGQYPLTRLRRLRQKEWSRGLVREHRLDVSDLIYPLFVQEGSQLCSPIPSMPDQYRFSIDLLIEHVKQAVAVGISMIALFPAIDPSLKTEGAEEAFQENNLMCRAIRAIKVDLPSICIIADVALDPYTTHGHDGIVIDNDVHNDETIAVLCKQARVLAQAGCDVIAPSDMMDGRIKAIRMMLEEEGFTHTSIFAYSVKYASHFYKPFRTAVGSSAAGSKATYQVDPANRREVMHEIAMDIDEGADTVIIKPGMLYLDVVYAAHIQFDVPILAYQVSGEYAMIMATVQQGWGNEEGMLMESLISFKRAGASAIFTYAALKIANLLYNKKG